MNQEKIARLEANGWKVGTPAQFLGLSPEQEAIAKIKITLRKMLREGRESCGLTQRDVAQKLNTKKEAITRMESAGPVTLDNLFRALLVVGVPMEQIAEVVASAQPAGENSSTEAFVTPIKTKATRPTRAPKPRLTRAKATSTSRVRKRELVAS